MRKLLTIGLYLMVVLCIAGCSLSKNIPEEITGKFSKWAEIYKTTLDSYLKQDTALNDDIDFIAIDFTTLEFTNDIDKNEIEEWFGIQYVPVKNTNLDGLREEGLFDGMYIPDGVFLTINKVTEKNNEIIIEGMKYRSALGANWFETKWRLNNGIWEFIGTVMTMIS